MECPEWPGQIEEEGDEEGEDEEEAAYANGADGERTGKGRWGWGSAESLYDESGEEGMEGGREGGQRWTINHAATTIIC